ncbi:hypothetical protein AB0F96_27025 [Streptomyces sp. NPDC023998]|uniref:hypothetical protein n=1 Tax=Streptomyces sp. NPDC023998 TaxID=3154597 RepID=UPI0033E85205
MSHGNRLSQKARYFAACTSTDYLIGWQRLSADRARDPIPDTSGDQALLEASLLERLGGTFDYCAHPVGIASIDPGPDRITVRIDPLMGLRQSPLALHSLAMLLPTRYVGVESNLDEPGGIMGLRIAGLDDQGLYLSMAGTTAAATLTGPTAVQWSTYLATHRAWCSENHLQPLWDTPRLHPDERAFTASAPSLTRHRSETAWVGSGLLRRIALLHTATHPYRVGYWNDGSAWKLDISYAYGARGSHDVFVKQLLHPRWGLPLAIEHAYCECADGIADADPASERMCSLRLASHGDRRGGIDFRFRAATRQCDLSTRHAALASAGAAPSWLKRAFPVQQDRRP